MHRIHTLLVTAYLLGGIALMATTPFTYLQGQVLSSGGSTIVEATKEPLHEAAISDIHASDDVAVAARRANAGRQLVLGVLLFTLGGFVHAYGRVRYERPVHITVKKKKPRTLFWVQMKV